MKVVCRLSVSLLPVECRWRSSSGTQLAERPEIKQIAAEVPLEELQRHSTVRNVLNQVYCRRRAAGEVPAALNRQKCLKSSLLPPTCRWRSSSGTQLAERPGIKQIAAEEPLEELQRHSTVRKPINQINCRQSALGIVPRALQRQNSLQTHPPDQKGFHISSLASM